MTSSLTSKMKYRTTPHQSVVQAAVQVAVRPTQRPTIFPSVFVFAFIASISSTFALPLSIPTANPVASPAEISRARALSSAASSVNRSQKPKLFAENKVEEEVVVDAPLNSVNGTPEENKAALNKAAGDALKKKSKSSETFTSDEPASKPKIIGSQADKNEPTSKVFLFTHSLPSPLNLTAGSYTFGTRAAIGMTDFIEISTNLYRDVHRKFNIQMKMPIVEVPYFLAAIFVDYQNYNFHHHDSLNPDVGIAAWMPGVVTGFELVNDTVIYVGGNLNLTNRSIPKNLITSGLAYGSRLNCDWSWMYNTSGGKLALNTLSIGGTYDLTSKVVGMGLTHHWETFDLGFHYSLNADRQNWLPIVNFISKF